MTREVLIILFKRERKKQKVAVEAPPGHYLMAIADFFFSKKKNVRVFIPLIADMREEYYAALIQHRQWKAMWIKIRGTWSFFATIGVDRAYSFLLLFVKTWKGVR